MRREILVAIVAIVMASTAFAQRMLPNSYIEKPTPTLPALIAHVKNNPKVMDRYVRHFQMTPDEVITFLKSLHMGKLKKDMYFNVWNVPDSTGELRVRRLLFKKGEKFFFDKNNTPVIAVACGNPIIRTDQADTPRITPSVSTPIGPVEVELPGVAPLNMDMSIMQPATPATPEVIVDTTPPSSSPSPAPLLGLLPALFIGLNNGGGGGTIPEPSTVVLLGAGCAYLLARAKRRLR